MPYKDPEKRNEWCKKYRQRNKDKIKEYNKEYRQTPQRKKTKRISQWKKQAIIFHDYDLLHDIYLATTHCDFCKCLLNQCNKSRKCVDHNHDINDDINVRGIICHVCNIRGVLD